MRNKIILAMAAAGMMYGASVFAADTTPTAGPFGSGKILSLVPSPTHPVISHRATMRSPFRLTDFLP